MTVLKVLGSAVTVSMHESHARPHLSEVGCKLLLVIDRRIVYAMKYPSEQRVILMTDRIRTSSPSKSSRGKNNVLCVSLEEITCGGTTLANGTYLVSPGYPSTYSNVLTCTMKVSHTPGICQLRLDFESFETFPPDQFGESLILSLKFLDCAS